MPSNMDYTALIEADDISAPEPLIIKPKSQLFFDPLARFLPETKLGMKHAASLLVKRL